MVRLGIQESIAPQLLQDFTREVELVRIPAEAPALSEVEWGSAVPQPASNPQEITTTGYRVVTNERPFDDY